jgi:hypothetical protein
MVPRNIATDAAMHGTTQGTHLHHVSSRERSVASRTPAPLNLHRSSAIGKAEQTPWLRVSRQPGFQWSKPGARGPCEEMIVHHRLNSRPIRRAYLTRPGLLVIAPLQSGCRDTTGPPCMTAHAHPDVAGPNRGYANFLHHAPLRHWRAIPAMLLWPGV